MVESDPQSVRGGGNSETPEAAKDDSGRAQLSMEDRFEILKNTRRRLVIEYLVDSQGTVELADLADYVTAIENDTDISEITSTERKRVYVGLYQFHLPKMADMGVIDYDKNRGEVTLTESGKSLYKKHESAKKGGNRWIQYYSLLTVAGVVAVVVSLYTWDPVITITLLSVQTVLIGLVTILYGARTGNLPVFQ